MTRLFLPLMLLLFYQPQQPDKLIVELQHKAAEFYTAHDYDSAYHYYSLASNLYEPGMDIQATQAAAKAFNSLGWLKAQRTDDYLGAYRALNQANTLATETGMDSLLASIKINLGNVYAIYDDYTNAFNYYYQAAEDAVKVKDYQGAGIALENVITMALAYNKTGNHLKRWERIWQTLPSTFPNYQSLSYNHDMLVASLNHDWRGIYDASQRHYLFVKKHGRDYAAWIDQLMLAHAANKMKRYDLAKAHALNILNHPGQSLSTLQREAAKLLAEVYKSAYNNDSAIVWYDRFYAMDDSLFRPQRYNTLRDLVQTMDQAEAQNHLSEERARRQRMTLWLWVTVGILLLVTGAGVVILRQNAELRRRGKALFDKDTKELEAVAPTLLTPYSGNEKSEPDPLLQKIHEVLADEKLVTDPEFSLTTLAHHCNASTRAVSAAINQEQDANFNTLLANTRVRIISRLLRDPSKANLTIEALAREAGFQSRSHVSDHFRRVTGLTPSQYRKLGMS